MSVDAQKETLQFQAEVSQVLNLVIRSLYSNKEIFLRELVSNASDAAEKLRFESLTNEALMEGDGDLKVRVDVDSEANTITISDNGIGMNREEVMATIGSIASSGTRKFLESMTGDQSKDSQLIGQFGVGFYSAFIVAEKVTLLTRRAGESEGVLWASNGEGEYSIENTEKATRGTEVTLHLREDETEFTNAWNVKNIITKFSDHISIPVEMLEDVPPPAEGEEAKTPEYEQINKGSALWQRNKSDITTEEYADFYKTISHDFEEPLAHVHNRVEGNNEYTSLLYVPKRAPFDLWDREQKHGVKLFVRRVFIMDEADKLMPHYLRFVKGVVDSDDLPLNVSREILQHNKKIDNIRNASTKKILSMLEKMAKNDAENYAIFWNEFGKVLKEGPAEDMANKEKISGLLRFASTETTGDEQTVSLDDYIARMKEGQDKVYYITADSTAAARHSPHLEIFRKKGIEVLLMSDRVDEWLMSHITEYKEKTFQSIAKGALDLDDIKSDVEEETKDNDKELEESFIERIKTALGDGVKDVRSSKRLTDSPACLVVEDHDMSANLARVLQQVGQEAPMPKPILEINPSHPLVERMDKESDEDLFKDMASVLFDQAMLAEGGQLEDPASFVHRLNALMLSLAD